MSSSPTDHQGPPDRSPPAALGVRAQLQLFAVPMLLIGLVAAVALLFGRNDAREASSPWSHVPAPTPHVDHASFFVGAKLEDGPSVTRRCLECHPLAGNEVKQGAHFLWQGDPVLVPGHREPLRIGKKNVINNFCIGVQSNWESCTRCHAGYGWEDEGFDFDDTEAVDCLVCHEQSGGYEKGLAGHPKEGVDLLAAAQSVAAPTRNNCGVCHFAGGGGDAVKHGDLDSSMLNPRERIDVHMGALDLQCIDCHQTEHHSIPGRSMSVSVDAQRRVRCTDCHQDTVHEDQRVEGHLDAVACQTCHIPSMAIDTPTKMAWDWSTAGDLEREKRVDDDHEYMAIKGSFVYQSDVPPEYAWYDGTSTRYLLGDRIDPQSVTVLAGPVGSASSAQAKIWPFKVHRGKQIYDVEHKTFIVPKTFGEGGFWTTFDWQQAAELGCEATGLECSGNYDFAPTEMYWPLSHMVQKSERALTCGECHGESGRMDWASLGYPGDPLTRGGRHEQGLVR